MLAVLACAALVSLCQATPSLSTGSVPTLETGGEVEISIALEGADAGVSGYNLTFSLTDPDTAHIVAVTFPGWAGLHQSGPLPADSVWAEAVDLSDSAETAGDPITLCTITLKGVQEGSTVLRIISGEVQDNNGDTISLADTASQIVVSGAVADDGGRDSPSPVTTVATTGVDTPETPAEIPALSESPAVITTVSPTTPPEPQDSSGPLAVVILILSLLIGYFIRNLE